ncbi:MAG TPA: adenylate/guanylate cyclase domain-containing protein [Rhodospirillales bacterium]|jgi:adenylate cyclase
MVQQVNYEVQVQQNGRWSIHARFAGHQKDGAVEEAKQLDQLPNVEAVKVIKEVYDTDQGFHNEFIIYKSAGMKSTVAQEAEKVSGGHSGPMHREETWLRHHDDEEDEGDDFDAAPARAASKRAKKGKKKKGSSLTTIVVKLLLVVLFSLGLAAMFAWLAAELFGGTKLFGVRMVGNAESNMLIGVFIFTFLTSAAAMAITVMKGESLDTSRRRGGFFSGTAKARPAAQKPAAAKKPAAPATAQPTPTTDALDRLDEAMRGVGEYKLDEAAKTAEDQAVSERLQAELNKGKEKPAEEEKTTARGFVLDAQTQAKPAAEVEPPSLSPQAQQQKTYVMNFLSKGLGGAIDKKKLDNFNKFGVNLFLAGACEVLAQNKGLDVLSRSRILGEGVQVMGFKKSHAASFADRYEEYLMADARYMQMFQAGRNAMNIYATDETAAPKLLESALTEWNKPKQREAQAGPVTVLFTDIAGSTAMTQTLGDAGAQQVVRAHNRIVREALSATAGKEIKHTGDGIMASFAKTSDGVDAAIQMQREVAAHNQHNPNLPLHLKIGLNAGEPIAEDNDLFGTTVQLSARIVDKAKADQIFVSEIVRGICAGKTYKFINRGGFPMKGFGDDVILYEVMWNEAAASQAAAGGAQGQARNFAPTQQHQPAAQGAKPV